MTTTGNIIKKHCREQKREQSRFELLYSICKVENEGGGVISCCHGNLRCVGVFNVCIKRIKA